MEQNRANLAALHLSRQGVKRIRELAGQCPFIKLVESTSDLEVFEHQVRQTQPAMVLAEFSPERPDLLALLDRIRQAAPNTLLMALSSSSEAEHVRLAMHHGVREFLDMGVGNEEFNQAVAKLLRMGQESAGIGQLVALIGVKGSMGASHLALNLCRVMSKEMQRRTVLYDLDFANADQSTLLDIDPKHNMTHLVANYERMDGALLDSLITKTPDGFNLLAAPGSHVEAEMIEPKHVSRTLDLLLYSWEVVLADLSSRWDEISLATLERADQVLLMADPSILALKRAQRILDLIRHMGKTYHNLTVVVNRSDSRHGISKSDIKKILQNRPLLWLPNATKEVMQAGNAGRPVVDIYPRSKWSKAVRAMAEDLVKKSSVARQVKTHSTRQAHDKAAEAVAS